MRTRGHLNSLEVLIFSNAVSGSNCMNASSLKNELVKFVENAIGAWATRVRDGYNYEQIKEFARKHSSIFDANLEQLIEKSYANSINNAEKVLAFVDGLAMEHKVIGYPILFKAMKSSNGLNGHELIMLAYRVKEIINSNIATDQKNDLENKIKSQLSSGIRALLWDSYVFIESKKHSGHYLGLVQFATGRYYRPGPYRVATEKDKSKWTVNIYNRGRYFQFIEQDTSRSFLASDSSEVLNNDSNGSNDYEYHWEVIPVENGAYFYFKNRRNGRILDSKDLVSAWTSFSSLSIVETDGHYTGTDYHQWKIS